MRENDDVGVKNNGKKAKSNRTNLMAEKSRKLRITREAQGTSWMKMALNLVIRITIGQDNGKGDYEDGSKPGYQVVN